jgi:predicted RNase H-like nuclease (RuvC/YqgF family)
MRACDALEEQAHAMNEAADALSEQVRELEKQLARKRDAVELLRSEARRRSSRAMDMAGRVLMGGDH